MNTSISTRLYSLIDLDLDIWDIIITDLMHVLADNSDNLCPYQWNRAGVAASDLGQQ